MTKSGEAISLSMMRLLLRHTNDIEIWIVTQPPRGEEAQRAGEDEINTSSETAGGQKYFDL